MSALFSWDFGARNPNLPRFSRAFSLPRFVGNHQPVYDKGNWHEVHARKDCCTNCHGGNYFATDKELAHEGVVASPLKDVYTSCHACHPDDYWQRAEVFAAELKVTPASRATPTPVPTTDPAGIQSNIDSFTLADRSPVFPSSQMVTFTSIGLTISIIFFVLGFLTYRASLH